jgi:NADPH-dependent glutamate synthase beta subunit-like oxidoreductase
MPRQRTMRPQYVDRLAPCNDACPAGEDVQGWLAEAQAGRYRAAWAIILLANPLPAVHGRVCYHPCETACNRGQVDGAVAIHSIERFIGDLALEQQWPVDPPEPASGKRVLIVGAGPSGLSAAWQLARRGHAVSIYEGGPVAGGMMHFGIPKYRLPREVLDAEIARIASLGVDIQVNRPVTDVLREKTDGHFDVVFLAVGAHLSKRQDIPAADASRLYDALQFLKHVEFIPEKPYLGRRVAVYGGGNTAMDAARTARRLGAEPLIIYRRTRREMPAHSFELDEALEEGVQVHWLRTISAIDPSGLRVEVMKLDENGRAVPTGEFENLEADTLILALGQDTDTGFLRNVPGIRFNRDSTVIVGADMQTGHPAIFAGGDMVPYARTVTTAIGHGREAARHIHAFLAGLPATRPDQPGIATFESLRLWYGAQAARSMQPQISTDQRIGTFEEVTGGLDVRAAWYEAQRCFSCGNCFECDGCYSACPEQAVRKLGPGKRYEYDLETCTGCAICFDQCPCGAITMVPEHPVALNRGDAR